MLHLELLIDDNMAPLEYEQAFTDLVAFAGRHEASLPGGTWDVTVRLTDDARIAVIHDEFFGDGSATDVISFPSGESLSADTGYLGDVVISVETAGANATDVGHAVQREIAFLILHGLLHLAGHDDQTAADREQMLARQQVILVAYEAEHGAF